MKQTVDQPAAEREPDHVTPDPMTFVPRYGWIPTAHAEAAQAAYDALPVDAAACGACNGSGTKGSLDTDVFECTVCDGTGLSARHRVEPDQHVPAFDTLAKVEQPAAPVELAAERVALDIRCSKAFLALHRAVEFDGMPGPLAVHFLYDAVALQFDDDQTAAVDDWAGLLNMPTDLGTSLMGAAHRPWRKYAVSGQVDGIAVRVWCPSLVKQDVAS